MDSAKLGVQSLTLSQSQESQGFVAKSNHLSLVLESRVNGWDKRMFAEEINPDFDYLVTRPNCCPQCNAAKVTGQTTGTANKEKSVCDTGQFSLNKVNNRNEALSSVDGKTTKSTAASLQTNQNSYIRKKVASLQVICPHSIAYRNKMNQENEKDKKELGTEKETTKKNKDGDKEDCTWQGRLSELEEHLKETCKYRSLKCPFNGSGCCFEQAQSQVNVHLAQEHVYHLNLLFSELKTLKEQMKIQNDQVSIQSLEVENSDLRTIVEMLAEDKSNSFNWMSNDNVIKKTYNKNPLNNKIKKKKDNNEKIDDDAKHEMDIGLGFAGLNSRARENTRKNRHRNAVDKKQLSLPHTGQSKKHLTKSTFDWEFDSGGHSTTSNKIDNKCAKKVQKCVHAFGEFSNDDEAAQMPWYEKFQMNDEAPLGEQLHSFECLKYWDETNQVWVKGCGEGKIGWAKNEESTDLKVIVKDKASNEVKMSLKEIEQVERKKMNVQYVATNDHYSFNISKPLKFLVQFRNIDGMHFSFIAYHLGSFNICISLTLLIQIFVKMQK
ncbi:hypothetical protein RFI_01217 [Reticulomyxa filosa]|uniref:TRAF-type domain-containing protein n=1 Tax=Reticulomyxa filosa TaxID=46433 RepID=X6PCQ0_RETFI|nr:hypothetical protein RFI_01217 [Reticulomyxa filosa]|eukprot:ETO35844.1 hypothetical protein RFI_01217 [Reticulomyxa filosa]